MGSRRYDVSKLIDLANSYLEGSDYAKIELSKRIIDGEDLIEILDDNNLMKEHRKTKVYYEEKCEECDKLTEENTKLKKDYETLKEEYNKNITADIEKLIEGKEGVIADKIRKILKED